MPSRKNSLMLLYMKLETTVLANVYSRNLPDKEFRYLRTVIVTAAVYWGLNSKLRLR